jgi:hypothetical protein
MEKNKTYNNSGQSLKLLHVLKSSVLLVLVLVLFSCKREKVDVIGPEIAIASPSFKIENEFKAEHDVVDFRLDSNWFTAIFSQRVSWKIKLTGLQSKAIKEMEGTSDALSSANTRWSGAHSGLYFFKAGEDVVAELSVFGSTEKWYDTVRVQHEKNNYGNDVIIWWDMDQMGVARHGTVYWFDFYDGNCTTYPTPGCERMEDFVNNPHNDATSLQGIYRGIEGKDGSGPSNYFIGAVSHGGLSIPRGFDAPMKDIYLNFYVRRRTATTGLGVELICRHANASESALSYNVGELTEDGWKQVSIRLSEMTLEAGHTAFDPTRISQFRAGLQIVSGPGIDRTGVDLDFITITRGGPFNPAKH